MFCHFEERQRREILKFSLAAAGQSFSSVKNTVDRRGEMDHKFLPLSSSKTGFAYGIKKIWGNTMQKEDESYRIDVR
jgi:hypothetical protein